MQPAELKQLTDLIAKRFIQRPDVYAIQNSAGGYRPSGMAADGPSPYKPISRGEIKAHLLGEQTIGHYLLDMNNMTKVLAIDIDLAKAGWIPTQPYDPVKIAGTHDEMQAEFAAWRSSFAFCSDLRGAWHNRKLAGARQYLKSQMRMLAGIFAAPIHSLLQMDVAATYTGNKGVHVYGLPGTVTAASAKDAAELVLASLDWPELFRGQVFWRDSRGPHVQYDEANEPIPAAFPVDGDPAHFFNFHFEVFPKQTSLDGKKLGNLMRLPLGVNRHHPTDPTFFIDLTSPIRELRPVDPVWALTTPNPWGDVQPAA